MIFELKDGFKYEVAATEISSIESIGSEETDITVMGVGIKTVKGFARHILEEINNQRQVRYSAEIT